MAWWAWALLAMANTPIYLLWGRALFGGWSGFGEALEYSIKPDILSWIQGNGLDDLWAEVKLIFFILTSAGLLGLEYYLLRVYIL
jgi:hypothetical protein